ncbi:Glycosyltransferase [Candidatus Paraburkholderia calva]|nr:Glycosyltransferase [Candidatus Paraburkholderia calva]
MLKILHSESSRGWGGQEIRTLKEMLALRERDHTVELLCLRDANLGIRCAEHGFVVHHASMRGGNMRSMIRVKALLQRRRFDVLNTHSGHDSLIAGAAGWFASTPLIVRTRHLALPITSLTTYTWIPHRVIAISHYVRRYLISAGVPENRVHTIYNGIPKPDLPANSTLRAELRIGAEATVVCMVEIMRDEKGHEDLITAVLPLFESHPYQNVVMAGDGPAFERIKGIVRRLDLEQRIHLLGFRTDIPNIFRGSDMFVLPTRQEALGQAFIEAMAAGLPVIGTRVGGVPELIQDNVNGLLVQPHDPIALRAAIKRMIEDGALRERLRLSSLHIIERGFAIEDMACETELLYRRALHERGRQR